MEEINLTKEVISFTQDIGFIGVLIILAVPSLRKKIFNGNNETQALSDKLELIETNHLHTLESKLDKLVEEEIKGNEEVRTLIRLMSKKKRK